MKLKALLLALAFAVGVSGTADAAVTEHRETTINLSIAYPVLSLDNAAVADRINADIQMLAANFRAQFESGAFYRGELGYRVHLDDDNFLSVTFTDLRYALHDGEAVSGHLYNEQGRNTPIQPEKSVRQVPADYFLGGRGFVCPIFQPGELTASTGPTYILLDASVVDYFNRKNK